MISHEVMMPTMGVLLTVGSLFFAAAGLYGLKLLK